MPETTRDGIDELTLISAARRDPAAFAPLYDLHAADIYRFCYVRLGQRDAADDLTSRIFIRAIERLGQYQPRANASFRSWLFAIARNMLADDWRRRRDIRLIPAIEETAHDSSPGPEYLAVHRSEMDRLRRALRDLPDRQREIVELRLIGFHTNEIADTLGVSIAAVKSAQARAYRTLRDVLAPTSGADR